MQKKTVNEPIAAEVDNAAIGETSNETKSESTDKPALLFGCDPDNRKSMEAIVDTTSNRLSVAISITEDNHFELLFRESLKPLLTAEDMTNIQVNEDKVIGIRVANLNMLRSLGGFLEEVADNMELKMKEAGIAIHASTPTKVPEAPDKAPEVSEEAPAVNFEPKAKC